jgi:diguanylate cyclase (GGDEF)-like protein/PAS domain S-box-containing protein
MDEGHPSSFTEEDTRAWLREGAKEPLLHLDSAATIRRATPEAADILGYGPRDLVGLRLADLAVTEKLVTLRKLMDLIASGRKAPRVIELVCARGNGGQVHIEVQMVRPNDDMGYTLVLRLQDISNRQVTGAQDRRKLRWFQALTEHSGDVIIVANQASEHTFVSGAALSVLACTPEELTRQGWLDRIHPQDRGPIEKQLVEVEANEGERRTFDYRLRHADGHFLRVETKAINQLAHPDVEGVVYYIRDVGDRILRDPITGLPKRRLFVDRLDEIISERKRRAPFAVVVMSLERHRQVKNGLGPRFADEMLSEFAERAREVLDDRAMLARLTDGELAAVVDGVISADDAGRIADRLKTVGRAPFQLAGQTVHSEVNVGISLSARGYTRSDAMIRDAGTALVGSKEGGGAPVANTHLIQRVSRRLIMESDLRRALENDALCFHYQPIFDLVDRSLKGFEALIRWDHPRRGLISPGLFVPLAQETGLIKELDAWVIQAAAKQLNQWQARGLAEPELYVHINLSARAFQEEGLLQQLQEAVDSNGILTDQLRVELTESALVERPDVAAVILESIRREGFHVALDDFGTGYSSLSYLSRFAFDSLKIDRSFVSGPSGLEASGRTLKLVRAILEIGRSLGMVIVAEGIENDVQAGRLRAMGCRLAQGFHLARPMPAEDAARLLDQRVRKVAGA